MEFDKLCFEGCGIFGMAYVGGIKYLEEQHFLKNINEYAGTSSGAIVATMLALGYTADEIYGKLELINWNKFYDYNFGFFSLFSGYGIYKGVKLHNFYKDIIKNKTNSKNTTFQELYQNTNKKLYISAINLSKKKITRFSVDTHPHMEIHLALRLSTSLPFIFKTLKYNNDFYIDGGVMDNYPMEAFSDNTKALGFNFMTSPKNHYYINNICEFTTNIISAFTLAQNNLEMNTFENKTITIYSKNDDLLTSVLDIGKMKKELPEYFQLGYDTTKTFFNKLQT